KADFLKVVAYNNCGGERYRRFIENVGSAGFRAVPKDELLRFNNHLRRYRDEAGGGPLPAAAPSPPSGAPGTPPGRPPGGRGSAGFCPGSTSASRPARGAARRAQTTPTPPWPPHWGREPTGWCSRASIPKCGWTTSRPPAARSRIASVNREDDCP